MLTVEQLQLRRDQHVALLVDTLRHASGEITAIAGANGAGKSTLLRALSGDFAIEGRCLLHGKPLHEWSPLQRARHLGVLPQHSALNFPFLAEEVVALGLTPLRLNRREAQQQIRRHMALTDCAHLAARSYPALSGGEKQRVQLARVLLQLSQAELPPLLLLDEPTSAQDLGQQHALLQLLQQRCREHQFGVIAVLHDLNHILRYCQQCWLLSDGRLVKQGAPTAVLTPARIEQYWRYRPRQIVNDGLCSLV